MRKIKILTVIFSALVICLLSTVRAFASEITLPQDEWDGFESSIPDEVRDRLPDGGYQSQDDFAADVEKMSSGSYMAQVFLDIVGVELGGTAKLFFALCALILLSAVFSAFCSGMENSALSSAVRFCSAGALISVVIYTQYEHFEMLEELFEKMGVMMNGMIPAVAGIWAMGGNVSTASVGSASFGVMLAVSEALFASTVIPICCILTVFGFCDALTDEMKTGKIIGALKKTYVFVLGAVMTLLLASLGAQTSLATAADTTAARAARMVSGSVIPVLGGSVGETFRSVAAGVSYLKNLFGIGAIGMIALLVMPTLVSLLLTRFAFMICTGLADMLGCSSEARMLDGLGESYGFMLAVVSSVAVMFILALCVFMQTAVAVA